jgi:hypothetical protein
MTGVHNIAVDSLTVIRDPRGELAIAEFRDLVPFPVVRLFYVRDVPAGSIRGQHGHYRCRQYMICLSGLIQIALDDGPQQRTLDLTAGQAILIEPGILAAETYQYADSILLVLCDRPYEKEDYFHNMAELAAFRTQNCDG